MTNPSNRDPIRQRVLSTVHALSFAIAAVLGVLLAFAQPLPERPNPAATTPLPTVVHQACETDLYLKHDAAPVHVRIDDRVVAALTGNKPCNARRNSPGNYQAARGPALRASTGR